MHWYEEMKTKSGGRHTYIAGSERCYSFCPDDPIKFTRIDARVRWNKTIILDWLRKKYIKSHSIASDFKAINQLRLATIDPKYDNGARRKFPP